MVRSLEERENSLRRSLSQPHGDGNRASDGLDPNAEVQRRAMQRYHKLVNSDPQIQVRLTSPPSDSITRPAPRCNAKFSEIQVYVAQTPLAHDDAQATLLRHHAFKGVQAWSAYRNLLHFLGCWHIFSLSGLISAAQASAYDQEKMQWLVDNCKTCVQMFEGVCKVYAERPMFVFCKSGCDSWQSITYQQVFDRVVHFASGAFPNLCWHPCLSHRLCVHNLVVAC